MGRCVHDFRARIPCSRGPDDGFWMSDAEPAPRRCAVAAASHPGVAGRRRSESRIGSREALGAARSHNIRASFAAADGCALPFGNATFDSVFCVAVLQHIPDVGRGRPRTRAGDARPAGVWSRWSPTTARDISTVRSRAGRSAFEASSRFFSQPRARTQRHDRRRRRSAAAHAVCAGAASSCSTCSCSPSRGRSLARPPGRSGTAGGFAMNSALARAREPRTERARRRVPGRARPLRRRSGRCRAVLRGDPEHDAVRHRRAETRMRASAGVAGGDEQDAAS